MQRQEPRQDVAARLGVDIKVSIAGGAAAAAVGAAIVLGSRGLRYFDAALARYATATVFLAFGIVYRYMVWVQSPPASGLGLYGSGRGSGRSSLIS